MRLAVAGGSAELLMGRSPYRQWYVFRANHLIIVTGGTGPGAFALAEAVAATIAAHLPESKAMAARAQTPVDVVKLLQSHQLQVALLSADDAVEASRGGGRFKEEDPVRFRTLAVFGPYVLVALDDFSGEKAYQIAKTLAEYPPDWTVPEKVAVPGTPPIPFHPGALEYYEGHASPGGR